MADETPSISLWLPLLSSIVGGVLVWIGQYFERRYRKQEEENKRVEERKKDLREIYAYLRKLEAVMKNSYRELAMAKCHAEYWWYCFSIESNEKEKKEVFGRHLESQARARQIESKIGEDKAAFISHVRKFQAIKVIPEELERRLLLISDLTNAKADSFNAGADYHTVRFELYDKREENLRAKYFESLSDFKAINDTLQSLLPMAASS